MTKHQQLLGRLKKVRETATGWSACCPAHKDRDPSLSVSTGDNGRVLVNCHAGCSPKAIVEAVGLTEADLFEDSGQHQQPKKRAARSYETADQAERVYERTLGKPSTVYDYQVDHELVGRVLRWSQPDGSKKIRPVSLHRDGWQPVAMPEPRPLYRHDELAESTGRVYVAEGEKCVEALRSIGLTATTNAGGCKAEHQADWYLLAGREVVVIPDADEAGRQYAKNVAGLLQQLDPPASVRIVDLSPDRSDGYDVADMVAACTDDTQATALRETIEQLAGEAEPIVRLVATSTATSSSAWQPYPTDALPEPLRDFVTEAAASIGCDETFVALPLLAAAGAAIGTTARLALKPDWPVPPILWPVVVGESGTAKSPALAAVTEHVQRHEKELRDQHLADVGDFEAAKASHDKAFSAWQKSKKDEQPPRRPEYPVAQRALVVDPTVEALATVLADNPRGVLLARDELAGWLGSMDRYASGRSGGDEAFWLSAYDGRPHSVDRRTGNRTSIYVQSVAVWITGCIQPGVLRRSVGTERRESGLLARLLLAAPPKQPQLWSETTVGVLTRDRLGSVLDGLYRLTSTTDRLGLACPRQVTLSREAKEIFVPWHDEHSQQTIGHTGDLAAAWSKLKEVAARIALILHEVSVVAGLHDQPDEVSKATIEAAIRLTEWHKNETRRVYELLAETEEEVTARQHDERLVAFVERRGGTVTARDVVAGCRHVATSDDAEAALSRLVAAGVGSWQRRPPGPAGGRPTRSFVLSAQPPKNPPGCQHNLDENRKNEVSLTADTADKSARILAAASA